MAAVAVVLVPFLILLAVLAVLVAAVRQQVTRLMVVQEILLRPLPLKATMAVVVEVRPEV
jgi:hypothetical protein